MEQMLAVNGVDLCVETFGAPEGPPILLIGGMSASMDYWEDDFCEALAAGGRFVIRYDHRDTGRSTSWPPGEPGYTGRDMVADIPALLDAVGLDRAHLFGISMGGALAQCVAVLHPERVETLILDETSPAFEGVPGVPPIGEELADFFEKASQSTMPDPDDHEALVTMLVEDQRAFVPERFDEGRMRAVVTQAVRRTPDMRPSLANHHVMGDGEPITATLADITAPTLVIHGTRDPLFPTGHGEVLAEGIPDATLLMLDGVGHEPPPIYTWETVVPAILDHTTARPDPRR
ncbi:pimeloyl-ACP methyl ester carboxylesterase [Nocardioides albertanoniae]|uniref:Pimeloyl-ACP methyl ester carboxylesterase n=2 Tax=Nocardioides albertanoniae TaxID=1175486 RepID=A0A543AC72_9ACTN|nr:pimeloyl-ACP methyl ester carboxylesterase [Nocardioides albertanoniae]